MCNFSQLHCFLRIIILQMFHVLLLLNTYLLMFCPICSKRFAYTPEDLLNGGNELSVPCAVKIKYRTQGDIDTLNLYTWRLT
jgi:hypothetical protein